MKKFNSLSLLLAIIAMCIFSCGPEKIDYALIKGNAPRLTKQEFSVAHGEEQLSIKVDEEGNFSDSIFLDSPSYWSIGQQNNKGQFFIEPGDIIELNISGLDFNKISYSGTNAEASNYLTKKAAKQEESKKTFDVVGFYSAEEESFLTQVEEKFNEDIELLQSFSALSPRFSEMEKQNIQYAKLMSLMSYKEGHKYFTKKTDFEPSETVTNQIKGVDFDNQSAFENFEHYRNLAVNHYSLIARDPDRLNELKETVKSLKSPIIKKTVVNNLSFFVSASNENLEEIVQLIMEESEDEDLKKKINAEYESLKLVTKGKESPEFNYESINGGSVSLSSLKGKLVYIDVWATWCGPCKREIPYLKQIEEQYHNKGIEFVSLSIDTQENKEKWQNFVKSQNLGGIQVLADKDWSSDFVKSYSITGIPRFILIDKEGKIINADAPRPSDPNLISLFEEYI